VYLSVGLYQLLQHDVNLSKVGTGGGIHVDCLLPSFIYLYSVVVCQDGDTHVGAEDGDDAEEVDIGSFFSFVN